jgi:hypothetical protein
MSDYRFLTERVEYIRKCLGLRLEDVAEEVELSRKTVSNFIVEPHRDRAPTTIRKFIDWVKAKEPQVKELKGQYGQAE